MASRLRLVKNGVPFDVSMSIPDYQVLAWSIIMGQADGGKWDFGSMKWKE